MRVYIRQLLERAVFFDREGDCEARAFMDENGRLVVDSRRGGWRYRFRPAPPDDTRPTVAGAKEDALKPARRPDPRIAEFCERVRIHDRKFAGSALAFDDGEGRLVIESEKGMWRFYFCPEPDEAAEATKDNEPRPSPRRRRRSKP